MSVGRQARATSRLRERLRRPTLMSALLLALMLASWRGFRWYVGSPSAALHDDWHVGVRVLDRAGEMLYFSPSHAGLRGIPLPVSEMGARMPLAIIVAEDRSFYEHDGIDRLALLRAAGQAAAAGHVVSGGSTITQQLVELLDTKGRPRRETLFAKLRELARSQNFEAELGKDEILEAYLNRLPFGNGVAGVAAASETYFGRPPAELTWAQATLLAVVPRAPATLDPRRHLDRALARQRQLLHDLHRLGHIDAAELELALSESIRIQPASWPFRAPLLSLRAIDEAAVDTAASDDVATSIDGAIQDEAEAILERHLPRLRRAGAGQAATIVVDAETGQIVAYAGSADWEDPNAGRLDMVMARRPAGSILKPFGYALAYQEGLRPADLLADVPTEISDGAAEYSPQNIDLDFLGPLPAAEALALSRNVPAVTVAEMVGTDALLGTLQEVGFGGLTESATHYGPALILGSAEVSLWEVAGAYTCLARAGECISLTWRRDERGASRRVFSSAAADLVVENLSNAEWRARFLQIGMAPTRFDVPVATKTGTSERHVDTRAVAFNERFVIAVWVGNADGTPTRALTGATGAGPIAVELVRLIAATWDGAARSARNWPTARLVAVEVCPFSGLLASNACPDSVERWFDSHNKPQSTCALHEHGSIVGGSPSPRFSCLRKGRGHAVVLPDEYGPWLAERRRRSSAGLQLDPYGYRWYVESEARDCAVSDSGE